MLDLRATLVNSSRILSDHHIQHALIGGFALAFYGINRATVDVDFLADGDKRDEIKTLLSQEGFKMILESEDVLQFSGSGFLDILLARRPMSRKMLERATFCSEIPVCVVTAEDLIGLKIQAYVNDSERVLQDKADIQSLIRKQKKLDWQLIKTYADLFGQWTEIQRLRDMQ